MTGKVQCQQLYYRWSGKGRNRGYQVVAATPGIDPRDSEFIQAHALPVSFSHDSFDRCLRSYGLPSGSTALSVVQNAGDDELGREGSYYSHFAIIPPLDVDHKIAAELALRKVLDGMISDQGRIDEEEGVTDIPAVEVDASSRFAFPDVRKHFRSEDDLGYFMAAMSRPGFSIVYRCSDHEKEKAFVDLFSLLSSFPVDPWEVSITTYTTSIDDERALFRVFLLDDGTRGAKPSFSQGTAVFSGGSLVNGTGFPLPEWMRGMARMLFNSDNASAERILRRSHGLPGSLNAYDGMAWSYNEDIFHREPTIEGALNLYDSAPDRNERMRYLSHAGGMLRTEDDCRNVSGIFLNRIGGAGIDEIDGILSDSMAALSQCRFSAIVKEHVDSALKTYRRNRDPFPYSDVFRSLSEKPDVIGMLIGSSGGRMREEIAGYIKTENLYSNSEYILSIARSIENGKSRARFLAHIFDNSFPDDAWDHRARFAESYLNLAEMDHYLAGRMISALAKEAVKSGDETRMKKVESMVAGMESGGVPEKYYAKARKQLQ